MTLFEKNFFDFSQFNTLSQNTSIDKKLAFLHECMGGEFWDDDKEIMTGSVAKIVSLGGFPIVLTDNRVCVLGQPIDQKDLLNAVSVASGTSAFMSYLNPSHHDLDRLGDIVVNKHKHLSVLHTFSVSILLSGISIGVENEFSCQRDIVHLSRVTVAKTKAQNSPCLVCRHKEYVDVYKNILHHTKETLKDKGHLFKDLEDRNLLFPTAKSSAVVLTGSLKNMLKLTALADDSGKEDEFVEALHRIRGILGDVFNL